MVVTNNLLTMDGEQSPDGFVIMSLDGPKLVLSPGLADEIKDDHRFSFFEANRRVWLHIMCPLTHRTCG